MDEQEKSFNFIIDNPIVMMSFCGSNNENLELMEKLLGNPIFAKKNQLVYIDSHNRGGDDFRSMCNILLDKITRKEEIEADFILAAYAQLTGRNEANERNITVKQDNKHQDIDEVLSQEEKSQLFELSKIVIPMTEKIIYAKSVNQAAVLRSFEENLLSFLVGPAGTGKTYLATAYALQQLLTKKKERYIITRPVVESGEKLGFLPGDLEQKILPYLRPIYDVLYELAGETIVNVLQEKKQIEISPLAYMRGRTLKNAVVLLDEAQNCSPAQMKMFLTRLGHGSIGIVNGDISQSDISGLNGLQHAMKIFNNVSHINIVKLDNRDIQRSKLAKIIIEAYNKAK